MHFIPVKKKKSSGAARDHEVSIATVAELKANSEGFAASRRGGQNISNATPKRSTLIMNRLPRSNRQRREPS